VLYYPIVLAGPLLLLLKRKAVQAQNVLFTTILAFVVCYVIFALYPVAGPNYTFEHPTGPVREVWSARLVYGLLGTGSSFGTAFPSSHVAATVAANIALWREWRVLAVTIVVPTVLLVVGTVYCQMHYGVDAVAGLLIGIAAGWVGAVVARKQADTRS
jgi:membrane-associated phospholipid phosphatase